MSVPAYNRKTSELEILNIVDELFRAVVSIAKDGNLVAKKNRKTMVEPMLDNVRKAMYAVNNANNYNLFDAKEQSERHRHQKCAFEHLNNVVIDCKFCMGYSDDHMYSMKFSNVLDLVIKAKSALRAWIKSDEKRI